MGNQLASLQGIKYNLPILTSHLEFQHRSFRPDKPEGNPGEHDWAHIGPLGLERRG